MTTRDWSRRDFLRTAGRWLAAAGLLPLSGLGQRARRRAGSGVPGPGARGEAASTPPGADLPPRTVGLRTLGGDFRFDPAGLRVAPGDSVTWLNLGDFHTATAFHPDNADLLPGDVPPRIPEKAEPWHSGMLGLSDGTEFTYTFRVPGVYDYFCQPHHSFGMVGRVVAGGPRGGPAVRRPLSELNRASREAMPTVEAITGPVGRTYEWAARLNGLLLVQSREGPVAAAARAVAAGVGDDAGLRELASGSAVSGRLRSRLDAVVESAEGSAGFAGLLDRVDAAKEALAELR